MVNQQQIIDRISYEGSVSLKQIATRLDLPWNESTRKSKALYAVGVGIGVARSIASFGISTAALNSATLTTKAAAKYIARDLVSDSVFNSVQLANDINTYKFL